MIDKIIIGLITTSMSLNSNVLKENNADLGTSFLMENKDISIIDDGYFNDIFYNLQWQYNNINAEKAWDIYKPNKIIKVAVLDSGVSISDTDVTYCLNVNESKSFIEGFDSGYATEEVTDDIDISHIVHGSIVSSLICAKQNNNIGGVGLSNSIELISLRVFDDYGNLDKYSDLENAIKYCSKIGVDIINFSGSFSNYNQGIYDAINNFDGLFVCSAGNSGKDIDNKINSYPSNYDLDNILSVGSTNENNDISIINKPSNFGKDSVDIFAPGEDVVGIGYDNLPYKSYGTSFVAPLVSGAAAMYLSMHKDIDAINLKEKILSNCLKKTSLNEYCVSGGLLNVYKLLSDHNYDNHYSYSNPKKHKAYCSCGTFKEVGHVVAGGSFSDGKRYATCLLCGGNAEIGFTMDISLDNEIYFELIDGEYYVNKTCYIDEVLNLSYEDFLNYEKENY